MTTTNERTTVIPMDTTVNYKSNAGDIATILGTVQDEGKTFVVFRYYSPNGKVSSRWVLEESAFLVRWTPMPPRYTVEIRDPDYGEKFFPLHGGQLSTDLELNDFDEWLWGPRAVIVEDK